MKTEIFVPQTEILTPETLAAEPKNTEQGAWTRHAATLLGVLGVASLARSASAQDANTMPPMTGTGAAPSTGTAPMGDGAMMNNPAPMMGEMESPMVPSPTDNQAMPGNSAVPSTSRNPNNPATTIPKAATSATANDQSILNFALGLEFLEADFYARVVAAHQTRPYLNARALLAAQKLANDEAAHVTAITDILTRAGATPVAKPTFRFPDAVFYSQTAFLEQATQFEETGVGAYLNAAPMVDSKDALRFAASVYGIECRHTGLIRNLAGRSFAPTELELPLSVEEVQRRVAPFIVA